MSKSYRCENETPKGIHLTLKRCKGGAHDQKQDRKSKQKQTLNQTLRELGY